MYQVCQRVNCSHIAVTGSLVPCNHIENICRELTVAQGCRCVCRMTYKAALAHWNLDPKAEPAPLARLYLQRLGSQPSLLVLEPSDEPNENAQNSGRAGGRYSRPHKSKCLGCGDCNGPEWFFKTEAVTGLRASFCKYYFDRSVHQHCMAISRWPNVHALHLLA